MLAPAGAERKKKRGGGGNQQREYMTTTRLTHQSHVTATEAQRTQTVSVSQPLLQSDSLEVASREEIACCWRVQQSERVHVSVYVSVSVSVYVSAYECVGMRREAEEELAAERWGKVNTWQFKKPIKSACTHAPFGNCKWSANKVYGFQIQHPAFIDSSQTVCKDKQTRMP